MIHVLQIGEQDDWSRDIAMPDTIYWYYTTASELEVFLERWQTTTSSNKEIFQVILLTTPIVDSLHLLLPYHTPYAVLYDSTLVFTDEHMLDFFKRTCARAYTIADKEKHVQEFATYFYSGQYGERMHVQDLMVAPHFFGDVTYHGRIGATFSGDFGDTFKTVASWKHNRIVKKGAAVQLWPEFQLSGTADVQYTIYMIEEGSTHTVTNVMYVTGEQLKEHILIEAPQHCGLYISVGIQLKGSGTVEVGPVHYRLARKQYGELLVGGKRLIDSKRGELLYYFEPGDLKPPLTVYFSGYRTAEGFEGYWMMKKRGMPFLLFSDPRLEGGAFYIGSAELERQVVETIQQYLVQLGFTNKDLILSGMSMGTFAALHYASDVSPHAVVVSKPLVHLGDIAVRERTIRPGLFQTSLDVLKFVTGGMSDAHVTALNDVFWTHIDKDRLKHTKFAVVYLTHDDYDTDAYHHLISYLHETTQVIGKSFVGKHTDQTEMTVRYFLKFLDTLLVEDFGREQA